MNTVSRTKMPLSSDLIVAIARKSLISNCELEGKLTPQAHVTVLFCQLQGGAYQIKSESVHINTVFYARSFLNLAKMSFSLSLINSAKFSSDRSTLGI